MPDLFPGFEIETGATFSPCGLYRYRLWRRWGPARPVVWICLNPSKADAMVNDPTVERLQRRAVQWGYDGLEVVNLFAFRETDPYTMKAQSDPVGPENDRAILTAARSAALVIAAWGNHGAHHRRSQAVRQMLDEAGIELHCLQVGKTGEPSHPLYLSYDLRPIRLKGGGNISEFPEDLRIREFPAVPKT